MKTTLMAGLMIGAATTVSANDATDLITRFYASVDDPRQSVSDLGRYFSRDITDNDRPRIAPANLPDAAVALNLFAELRSGFPDMRHSLDILAGIADDMAFVYWTFTATHQGDFFGKPATGRAVEIAGVDIFRVADGAFVEQWHVEDLMTLFQQIDFAD